MHAVVEMPFPSNEVRNGCYKHVDRRLLVLWRYLRRILPKYGFGRFRLVPIWSNGRAAARYFAKYVSKTFELRDERDGRSRRWCTRGSARRAKCSFAFNENGPTTTPGVKKTCLFPLNGPSIQNVEFCSSMGQSFPLIR